MASVLAYVLDLSWPLGMGIRGSLCQCIVSTGGFELLRIMVRPPVREPVGPEADRRRSYLPSRFDHPQHGGKRYGGFSVSSWTWRGTQQSFEPRYCQLPSQVLLPLQGLCWSETSGSDKPNFQAKTGQKSQDTISKRQQSKLYHNYWFPCALTTRATDRPLVRFWATPLGQKRSPRASWYGQFS